MVQVMDETLFSLAQSRVGKDIARVMDVGMSLEVGEIILFLIRVVSRRL